MAKARPITETEFRRVLAVAGATRHPERNTLCLVLSARAGMRVGEIRELDMGDVYDYEIGAIRDRIYLAADRVKWNHAREVHLNRTVRRHIEAYLQVRGTDDGPFILTQSVKRFSLFPFINHYRTLYRKAGIETSSHAGRALFINTLADHGVSIRVIQKAVGHKSLSATNAYLSARPQEVKNAVELLR